jgi:hypothetical protein
MRGGRGERRLGVALLVSLALVRSLLKADLLRVAEAACTRTACTRAIDVYLVVA